MPADFDFEFIARRAASRGLTDDDAAFTERIKRLGHDIINLMDAAGREGIKTQIMLQTLAAVIGCTIKASTRTTGAGKLSGLIIAAELSKTILEISMED